ncbi:hypothetical protein EMIHUDRAFT_451161, partial [Emiliania huxleyi CCMP1516]|uniref:Uncharacterized protein n=2 Tax=Emiliania huxleyi TaxID=2903 RepID=A0A0D3J7T4_EMIH1
LLDEVLQRHPATPAVWLALLHLACGQSGAAALAVRLAQSPPRAVAEAKVPTSDASLLSESALLLQDGGLLRALLRRLPPGGSPSPLGAAALSSLRALLRCTDHGGANAAALVRAGVGPVRLLEVALPAPRRQAAHDALAAGPGPQPRGEAGERRREIGDKLARRLYGDSGATRASGQAARPPPAPAAVRASLLPLVSLGEGRVLLLLRVGSAEASAPSGSPSLRSGEGEVAEGPGRAGCEASRDGSPL